MGSPECQCGLMRSPEWASHKKKPRGLWSNPRGLWSNPRVLWSNPRVLWSNPRIKKTKGPLVEPKGPLVEPKAPCMTSCRQPLQQETGQARERHQVWGGSRGGAAAGHAQGWHLLWRHVLAHWNARGGGGSTHSQVRHASRFREGGGWSGHSHTEEGAHPHGILRLSIPGDIVLLQLSRNRTASRRGCRLICILLISTCC